VRANREAKETGRFWQDLYRATVRTDEASLLACAVYVDLNPIRSSRTQQVGKPSKSLFYHDINME